MYVEARIWSQIILSSFKINTKDAPHFQLQDIIGKDKTNECDEGFSNTVKKVAGKCADPASHPGQTQVAISSSEEMTMTNDRRDFQISAHASRALQRRHSTFERIKLKELKR